jgi:hypothetical protein
MPRIVVDMLYRLPRLQSTVAESRALVLRAEAEELLDLLQEESLQNHRILSRCAFIMASSLMHATWPITSADWSQARRKARSTTPSCPNECAMRAK